MNIKWFIDDIMSDEFYGAEFLNTLKRLDRKVELVKYVPFMGDTIDLELDEYNLGYGSLETTKLLANSGVSTFGRTSKFDFSAYVNSLPSENFVSSDYMLINMGMLLDNEKLSQLDFMFGTQIFIRPNTGYKLFSGQVISLNNPSSIRNLFVSGGADSNTIAVVSSACTINNEWRFFVSQDNGILTCSSYSASTRGTEKRGCPDHVASYVTDILSNLTNFPDKVMVIDIAEYSIHDVVRLGIVEFNCASSSGMYQCDPEPVILEMERVIVDEFNGD